MQPDAPAPEAPPVAVEPAPLFIQPKAADAAPRRTAPAPVAHDPEAPYGWIIDSVTKERRPKKTAGRQIKGGGQPVAAPKKRPATKARTATVASVAQGVPVVAEANHAAQVGSIIDMAWMVGASMPVAPPGKVLGVDVHRITVIAKAQAGVLKETRDETARGIGALADHVGSIGRVVEKVAAEDGPAWILLAMMALTPMVAATAALWRAPMAEVEQKAAAVAADWETFVAAQMGQAGPQQPAIDGELAMPPGAQYPGEVPLFETATVAA